MAARVLLVLGLGALYAQYSALTSPALQDAVSRIVEAKTSPVSYRDGFFLWTLNTGIEPLDRLLAHLVVLRWPLLLAGGSDAALTPVTISYAGLTSAIWTFLLLEGYRGGNKGRIIAFPTLFALLGQFLPVAFVTCVYGAIHLWTLNTTCTPIKQDLKVPRVVLTILPFVTLLGFAAPIAVSIVPMSSDLARWAVAVLSAWPVLATLAVFLVDVVFSWGKTSNSASGFVDPTATRTALKDSRYARLLKIVYGASFIVTAVTYIIGSMLPLVAFFAPVFIPFSLDLVQNQSFWISHITGAFGGIYWYRASDYILSSLGALIWAGSIYAQANVTGSTSYWKLSSLIIIAGPVAAAVWMVWERDCVVLGFSKNYGLSVSFDGDEKGKTRPRGCSGMGIGKWERGGKVLVLP
ncbi:uncharacterized protein BDV14DRAFT_197363 [Aspergillus stella-maris]|uniref:uncharacterized protein n=1 Tax=Aspergillus stella-maris TaxID=1810926 RepID=UPI003CCE032E